MKGKVIILEDDIILAKQISLVLEKYGYQTKHTVNSDLFFNELRTFQPDIILLDVILSGSKLNGIQVMKYMKTNLDMNFKIIVLSGEATTTQVEEIRAMGAYHFIEKGANFNLNQLLLHIDNALRYKKQEEENIGLQIDYINLKRQFTRSFPFIGECESIRQIRNQILQLDNSDEDIFLTGETGTGKEVAANYYYINSKRFGKPYHTINCSALTETLIESELFGHVKGAFTSADRNKTGFFEECSNGVLFLDEVTNLSIASQSKILRAIENKEIQIVGGSLKKVDTRLIFASNATIQQLNDQSIFRKDLFYRIEGNFIELPPLKDRENDIIYLMNFFFTNNIQKYAVSDISDLMLITDQLLSYSWPGNIRELKNFCKFIMINEREVNNRIILKHLQLKKQKQTNESNSRLDKYLSIPILKDSIAAFEKDYLLHYLGLYSWNVSNTAKQLGIERTTLYKKIKLLGLNPDKE